MRKFSSIWDKSVNEDMIESLQEKLKIHKRCCCFSRLHLIRFYNFYEWLGLWKIGGYVIPKSEEYIHK